VTRAHHPHEPLHFGGDLFGCLRRRRRVVVCWCCTGGLKGESDVVDDKLLKHSLDLDWATFLDWANVQSC